MRDVLPDGTVMQDGLVLNQRKSGLNAGQIHYPVKGYVTMIYGLDSDNNRDGETYVCDVVVPRLGMSLQAVPFLLDKADHDNYIHYGPTAASKNLDMTPFFDVFLDPKKHNGTCVLIHFVNGIVSEPVITKVFPTSRSGRKNLLSLPIGWSPDPRPATEADGDCFKVRYNGTYLFIDKDGNFEVKQTETTDLLANQKKSIEFQLQDPIAGGLQSLRFMMDNTALGSLLLEAVSLTGFTQSIELDTSANSLTLTSEGPAGANTVTLSPGSTSVEVAAGSVSLKAVGAEINIDGVTDTIDITDAAGDEIKMSPTGGIKASTVVGSTLNLTPTGMVGLGGPTAELLDLFDQLMDKMSSLITSMSTETHIGNLGYLTGPPTNASAYLAVQGQITAIKSLLATIKGGI